MNGSSEKRKPPIVLHGAGLQAGASACRRRAGRRKRRDAAVAPQWRMRPAVRGPANQFSACRENWIERVMHLEMATRVPSTATAKMSIQFNDAVRCTRGIASKQTPCVCMRTRHPRAPRAEPHRPRLSVEARKSPVLPQDALIRFDWRLTNLHTRTALVRDYAVAALGQSYWRRACRASRGARAARDRERSVKQGDRRQALRHRGGGQEPGEKQRDSARRRLLLTP
jgi:hypothetical protein